MNSAVPTILRATLLAVAIGARASAQVFDWSANAAVLFANNTLLGRPLEGGGAEFRISPPNWPLVTFRFATEWLYGRADRIGTPCAGLIEPGTCELEPVRDRSQMKTVRSGLTARVIGNRGGGVKLTADWFEARVTVDTHGLTSGEDLIADKLMWGPFLGASAGWVPLSRVPIGLELEAGVGWIMPVVAGHVFDGYAPFDGGIANRYVRLGLAWRP
jgi:hypothetical protein